MKNAYNNLGRLNSIALLLLALTNQRIAAAADAGEPIDLGHRYTMSSTAMNEVRTYFVHRPYGYELSNEAYPLLIVLDGNDHFGHVSTTMEFLAKAGRMPRSIVVGLDNTNRFRDLEPPPPGQPSPAVGGPDRFLAFIGDELIPHLDKQYRTRPYRVLAGHSAAGLFTVHALIKRPDIFKGYIVIAPAFGDSRQLAKDVGPFLAVNRDLRADLYMTMANERGQMLGGAYEMSSLLQENASREFRWQFRRYPEETHGSIALRSVYDGLQAIYEGWYIHEPAVMFDQGGLAALEKHYAAVSARVGYDVPVPESVLLTAQYWLVSRNRIDEAEAVAKRAVELNPESPQALLALGRVYHEKTNDGPRAVEYLSRLLALDPEWEFVRQMLIKRGADVETIAPRLALSAAALPPYTGRYRSADSEVTITAHQGKLYAQSVLGKHEIRAASPLRFYFVNEGGYIVFSKNTRGRIDRLVVHRAANDFEFGRVD